MLFVTAETVALVWFFMFPLLGAGVAGLDMSPMMPVVSMVRHWAYAIPLIILLKHTKDIPVSGMCQANK